MKTDSSLVFKDDSSGKVTLIPDYFFLSGKSKLHVFSRVSFYHQWIQNKINQVHNVNFFVGCNRIFFLDKLNKLDQTTASSHDRSGS